MSEGRSYLRTKRAKIRQPTEGEREREKGGLTTSRGRLTHKS